MIASAWRIAARPFTSAFRLRLELIQRRDERVRSSAVVFAANVDPSEQLQKARAHHVPRRAERRSSTIASASSSLTRAPAAQRAIVADLRGRACAARVASCARRVEQRVAFGAPRRPHQRGAEQHLQQRRLARRSSPPSGPARAPAERPRGGRARGAFGARSAAAGESIFARRASARRRAAFKASSNCRRPRRARARSRRLGRVRNRARYGENLPRRAPSPLAPGGYPPTELAARDAARR